MANAKSKAPQAVVEGDVPFISPAAAKAMSEVPVVHAGKCPTCGRDLCGER